MRQQLALAIPDKLLRREPTHALHKTALDLSAVDAFVDRLTAVVEDIDAAHLQVAGVAINFHLAGRSADREVIKGMTPTRVAIPMNLRRAVIPHRRHTHPLHPRLRCDLGESDPFGRMVYVKDASVAKFHVLRPAGVAPLGRKHFCRNRTQPFDDLLAGVFHRHTVHVRPARRRGGRGVRHFVRRRGHHANLPRFDAEQLCRDGFDVGVDPLPHLRAAVIHLHGSVGINQNQRPGLVEHGIREGNAEFDRRQGDAALAVRMRGVPSRDLRAAGGEVRPLFHIVPHLPDAVVFDLLSVVRRVCLAGAVI